VTTELRKHGWQSPNSNYGIAATLSSGTVFGTAGDSDGMFSSPYYVDFSPDGLRLVVCDTNNHRIQLFGVNDYNIEHITSYGTDGSQLPAPGDGEFGYPKGAVFSPDGSHILVADSGNNRFQMLGISNDVITHEFTYDGGGILLAPSGVCFSPDGARIAVVEKTIRRFQVFGFDGSAIAHQVSFGTSGTTNGEFVSPLDISFNNDGTRLVVADAGNSRLQVFGIVGNVITHQVSYGTIGAGAANFETPAGVKFTPDGTRIVVADAFNHRVRVLKITNNVITPLLSLGQRSIGNTVAGYFDTPYNVACSPDGLRIAVADMGNHRIQLL